MCSSTQVVGPRLREELLDVRLHDVRRLVVDDVDGEVTDLRVPEDRGEGGGVGPGRAQVTQAVGVVGVAGDDEGPPRPAHGPVAPAGVA